MELEKAERRNAELVSSNTSLAAELGNFKTYLRDTGNAGDEVTGSLSRYCAACIDRSVGNVLVMPTAGV